VDQYCVVVCGLRAGASDEASTWAPVAAALRMEQDEFSRRVAAALPRIVRQQLDRATAERIAQLLQGMQVDARALPDDAQLVYIDRDGSSRGPLPQSALDAFIEPGESYRLHGSPAWQTWPAAPEHDPFVKIAEPFDEVTIAPADESPDIPGDIADVANDEPAAAWEAPTAETSSPGMPPPLPPMPAAPEPPEATPPDADAAMPAPDDGQAPDDALINPPQDDPAPADPDPTEAPADAQVAPPVRSRFGRLLVLLVIVAVAAWAYLHWGADTHVDDSPPPAPVGQASHPADSATTAPAPATSVEAVPAIATSAAAASAGSTPAPAASVPASGGTTALPAAAATAPAAAASAAPATATSVSPAHAASTAGETASPATASSSAQR